MSPERASDLACLALIAVASALSWLFVVGVIGLAEYLF